ncbi:MAG: hypothetical protein GXO76_03875 [Calditrichaeota bacterium]|nr:hypothetical protein [Calditrichota bacterium]
MKKPSSQNPSALLWKENLRYLAGIGLVALVLFGLFFLFVRNYTHSKRVSQKSVIRVFPKNRADRQKLLELHYISRSHLNDSVLEFRGSFSDVSRLKKLGIPCAFMAEADYNLRVGKNYPSFAQIEKRLFDLTKKYPHWTQLDTIGRTAFYKRPILMLKLSNHPGKNQDKPAILLMAGQHAREPLGTLFLLALADSLLRAERRHSSNNSFIQKEEIFIIPLVNVDGYSYLIKNHIKFPFWRKNLRDNNGDGVFSPAVDGVDLNQNYDFNWANSGDADSRSWYYKGPRPFSEPETQAIRDVALKKHFVLMIDYHAYGQSVMFPWTKEIRPPDYDVLHELALGYARKCRKYRSRRHYEVRPLNGKSGFSVNWFYARFRTLSFMVDLGTEYFPPQKKVDFVIRQNMKGIRYMLRRVFQTGIEGQITDRMSGKPVAAIVQIQNDFSPVVAPLRSDSTFGHYWRILLPGEYTLSFQAEKFKTAVRKIHLSQGEHKILNVQLIPVH